MEDHNEKVVRIPITYSQRKINEMGEGYVPCEVSGRWLQFPDNVSDLRWIPVDVMTIGSDSTARKICELVIGKEDILRAINSIEVDKKED